MHNSVSSLISINKEIQEINKSAKLIVVTKTFIMTKIKPLVDFGHLILVKIKFKRGFRKVASH